MTPAEVLLGQVLIAWDEWRPMDPASAALALRRIGDALAEEQFAGSSRPTSTGADLVARYRAMAGAT